MSGARRLFAAALPEEGGAVVLGAAAARHARVLRLRAGEPIVLFDGRGGEADASIEELSGAEVRCRAGRRRRTRRAGPRLVLCQALPKGGKLDGIVRACTELGVEAFHLIESGRSVARPEPARAAKRIERLRRVATEASRQSGRADVPRLLEPAPLVDVLSRAPADAARLAFVVGAASPLDLACSEDAEEAWVVVGPEGGLAPDELAHLDAAGFSKVGLGATVLRVETAAVVAVSLASYALGGLRPS